MCLFHLSFIFLFIGTIVSLDMFDIGKTGEQIPVNLSQLETQNDAALMVIDYLTNKNNISVTNNAAYLDDQFLCSSNMSSAVREAIDSIIHIDPLCGICGNNHELN